TARENLRYTARLNGMDADACMPLIDELLDQVGLPEAKDQAAGTFSRGMRQRLGIADALLKDPDVLILDEPTMAIDPAGVAEILGLIVRLARERHLAVLLSSHLLGQVEEVCHRVGLFIGGRLIADGTPRELAARAGDATMSLDDAYRRLVADAATPEARAS
ncbi:MAG TPA: ABC transporter ATP-binding protein, partial [Candidatus Limnocylindria bacterium]